MPEFAKSLKQLSEVRGIAERVFWHGYIADQAAIYSTLDIIAVPSRYEEPFGLVAAEAAFFGLPVVVARKGGLSEIVVDGETGFFVEAQSSGSLAKRLEQHYRTLNCAAGWAQRPRARGTVLQPRPLHHGFLEIIDVGRQLKNRCDNCVRRPTKCARQVIDRCSCDGARREIRYTLEAVWWTLNQISDLRTNWSEDDHKRTAPPPRLRIELWRRHGVCDPNLEVRR